MANGKRTPDRSGPMPPAAEPPTPRYATQMAFEAGDRPTYERMREMGYGIGRRGRRRGRRGRR